MNMPNREKFAENQTLAVLSRLSMLVTPILLGFAITLGTAWLNEMRADIDQMKTEIPAVKERTRVLENNMDRGRADRQDFQRQTTDTLTKLVEMNTAIVRDLSALRSTVEAQQRQIDRGGR